MRPFIAHFSPLASSSFVSFFSSDQQRNSSESRRQHTGCGGSRPTSEHAPERLEHGVSPHETGGRWRAVGPSLAARAMASPTTPPTNDHAGRSPPHGLTIAARRDERAQPQASTIGATGGHDLPGTQ
jgi:hypothetical protein